MKNSVFITASLDGYIADKNGSIDWLTNFPNPTNDDMGYAEFMEDIDALIMGRTTFETVCGFDVDWPYQKPVFVLSNSLHEIPKSHQEKAFLAKGPLTKVLHQIHQKGLKKLYIDGGATIQSFLKENLIDEMIITTVPILLGGGAALFCELPKVIHLECTKTKTFPNGFTQNHYKLKNESLGIK